MQEVKINVEILKRIISGRRPHYHLWELRLENSRGRNWKNKQIINTYLNEWHHGIKRINLRRSWICDKIGASQKNMNLDEKLDWKQEEAL